MILGTRYDITSIQDGVESDGKFYAAKALYILQLSSGNPWVKLIYLGVMLKKIDLTW